MSKIDLYSQNIREEETALKMYIKQDRDKKQEEKRLVREYAKTIKHTLATTRFNSTTWAENCEMRKRNPNVKCIYGTPRQITEKIATDSTIFVLEMNNDLDIIMGIGLVRNHSITGKYAVYSTGNYNRHVYAGKTRIDREEMSAEEMIILKLIEAMCFRGINHSKRGQGILAFPMKLQYRCFVLGDINLTNYVRDMFKKRQNI